MPQLAPQTIAYLRAQGYSDDDIAQAQIVQPNQSSTGEPIGKLSTIGRNLLAKGGGYLGGGAGTLAGAEAGAALGALGGPAAPVTVPVGALAGAVVGGAGGSMLGQKAEQSVLPDDVYARLQQQAEEANAQNPITGLATDIGASALAAGGKPSTDGLVEC